MKIIFVILLALVMYGCSSDTLSPSDPTPTGALVYSKDSLFVDRSSPVVSGGFQALDQFDIGDTGTYLVTADFLKTHNDPAGYISLEARDSNNSTVVFSAFIYTDGLTANSLAHLSQTITLSPEFTSYSMFTALRMNTSVPVGTYAVFRNIRVYQQ